MTEERTHMLAPYAALTQALLDGRMSSSEFQSQYLQTFKYDRSVFDETDFDRLSAMFFALDAFTANRDLHEEGGVDEQGLRAEAERLIEYLRSV